jgi:Chaperone of endosialidase
MRKINLHSFASCLFAIGAASLVLGASRTARADCTSSSPCVSASNSGSGYGVYAGNTGAGDGVHAAVDNSNSGVAGENSGSGNGVFASGASGYGLYAQSTSDDGVHSVISNGNSAVAGINNDSSTGNGVYGRSNAIGVYGEAYNTLADGVDGYADGASSAGVYGSCSGEFCNAVYAEGNLAYTGSLINDSDERLKTQIESLNGSLEQLLRLRGVSFYWKDPADHGGNAGIQRGFVAQEFEKVFPEWVTTGPDGYKMIQTTGLDALEVEGLRTLRAKNDALEERVRQLENGRRVVASMGANGWGIGIAGLAVAGAIVVTRRRRRDEQSSR